MDDHGSTSERRRKAIAIDIWENEGGAPDRLSRARERRTRIAPDHVLSAVPARAHGSPWMDPARSRAVAWTGSSTGSSQAMAWPS